MKLKSKVIAVTGGSGYLGRDMVASILSEGGRVASVDLTSDHTPSGAYAIAADLTTLESAERAFQQAHEHFGRLDGLVTTAGGFIWQGVRDSSSLEEWDRLFNLNLKSCVIAAKCVLPYLERADGGSIVCIGAAASSKASKGMGAYTASKAGVSRFCEALADEMRPHRIRANAILPSIINSPANRAEMPQADFSRWVTAEELSRVAVFLLSEASSGINGASIPVVGRM